MKEGLTNFNLLIRKEEGKKNTQMMVKIITTMGKTERVILGHKLKFKTTVRQSMKRKLLKEGLTLLMLQQSESENNVKYANFQEENS